MGSSSRRHRQGLWIAASLVLALGIGAAMWTAAQARAEAISRATMEARVAAQTRLAPLLAPRDLTAPVVGQRAGSLGAAIGREILSASPIDEIRIYSAGGRVLYARDARIVGTRPSYIRDRVAEVAGGATSSWVRGGLLQTHVPIWLTQGGTVAVAELSQPVGPLAAEANGPWYGLAIGLGVLLIGSVAMVARTVRASMPAPVAATASPSGQARRLGPDAPADEHPGFRGLEEARRRAELRAEEAEESVRAVRAQLEDALARIEEMEEERMITRTSTTRGEGEIQALRDQLRETANRLHEVETENASLRERLALAERERTAASDGSDVAGLRARVEEAERRADELAEAMTRLEAELEYTRNRFHMSMLTAALREFDNDAIQIEETNGDHDAVVVHRSPLRAGKVR